MSNTQLYNKYRQQLFNYYCKEHETGFICKADYDIHISEDHGNVQCQNCGNVQKPVFITHPIHGDFCRCNKCGYDCPGWLSIT